MSSVDPWVDRSQHHGLLTLMNPDVPSSVDPWAHRSSGMRCKTCMWFAPKRTEATSPVEIGRCRRHAPTMNGYPVVFTNDWCGDHKLNENAI
jgi:hypothetical protein